MSAVAVRYLACGQSRRAIRRGGRPEGRGLSIRFQRCLAGSQGELVERIHRPSIAQMFCSLIRDQGFSISPLGTQDPWANPIKAAVSERAGWHPTPAGFKQNRIPGVGQRMGGEDDCARGVSHL